MGKPVTYFLLLLSLCFFSCKRHVCPTYYTSFNIEKGAPERFFNYFIEDTTTTDAPVAIKDTVTNDHRLLKFADGKDPGYDRMFTPKGTNAKGLTKKKKDPLALLFPKRKQSFMKVVRAKVSFSELDSLEAMELYAVSDSLFSPDRFKRDQYIYMKLFGFEILDSMEARAEREQARLDTLNEENLPKKERRKLRRARKKEYRRLKKAAKRGEIPQEEADAYYEEYLAKPKKEKKKKKGKKGEEDELEDGLDPDADSPLLPDDGSGEVEEGEEPKKEKKKKKRKKKKDKKKEEDPPPDE